MKSMSKPMAHKQKSIYAPVPDKPGVSSVMSNPSTSQDAVRSGTAKTPKTLGNRKA